MTRFAVGLALMAAVLASPAANAATVLNQENGHYYDAISMPDGIDWDDAKTDAESQTYTDPNGVAYQGHLATITTEGENNFVKAEFPDAVKDSGHWLGGYQAPEGPEPGGGWQWVTGEDFVYTNWASGEPNDGGLAENEDSLHFMNADGQWNDLPRATLQEGYVVEYVAVNSPPVADAGGPYEASTGGVQADIDPDTLNIKSGGRWVTAYLVADPEATAPVQLDGTNSVDPDGDAMSYAWTILDGETNEVATAQGAQPTVDLPVGAFTVTLIANDGASDSDPDSATITVTLLELAAIDPAAITLHGPAPGPAVSGERGRMQDEETLMVKFSRSGLTATLIPDELNLITVAGALSGQDTIRVIEQGK